MISTVAVDVYVLDSLMPDLVGHDRQPSAFLVYLLLWRLAHGSGVATTQVALRDIAEGSGLSKRAVQRRAGVAGEAPADRRRAGEHHGRAGVHRVAAVER